MANESEYGLDYGPAPLNREKAREASQKQVAKGKRKEPLSEETMDYASGTSAAAGDAPIPPLIKQMASERLKIEANQRAKEIINKSPLAFESTPRGFIKDLVVMRGRTMGEALSIIQEQYSKGDPFVRGLPGIDEFIENTPSTLELTLDKATEWTAEPLMRAGQGVNFIAKEMGYKGPRIFKGPTLEEIERNNKLRSETRPSNVTSDVLGIAGAIPGLAAMNVLEGAAMPLLAGGAARVVGSAGTKLAMKQATSGGVLTRAAVESVGKDRLARWLAKGTGALVGGLGFDMLYGKAPSVESVGANVAGAYLLGKLANKLSGRKAINKSFEFLSRATGIPEEELVSKVTTAEQMIDRLEQAGAPDNFINRVVRSGVETYGTTYGAFLGRWAAKARKTPGEAASLVEGIDNKQFLDAFRNGYQQSEVVIEKLGKKAKGLQSTGNFLRHLGAGDEYLDSISGTPDEFAEGAAKFFGRFLAQKGEQPNLLAGLTKHLKPKYYKTAIDEYNNFLDEMGFSGQAASPKLRWEALQSMRGPVRTPANITERLVMETPINIGGANKYYPAYSKWHLNNLARGGRLKVKGFKNPLEVEYKQGQIPAYAALSKFKANPKVVAAELQRLDYLLQNKTNIDLSQTQNVIEGMANRLAKRFGYDSILYKGPTPDKDIYVDLEKTTPINETATKLIDRFENDLRKAGRRAAGRNFLSVIGPVAAATAGTALFAEESQGVTIPSKAVAAGAKALLPKKFVTFISDIGEQLFGHVEGISTHRDLISKFKGFEKGGQDLVDKAIKKGFVRAGRGYDGPFAEFDWDNEQTRNRALAFLKDNHNPGDVVSVDIHKGGRQFSFMGSLPDAEQFIKTGEKPVRVSRMRDFLGIVLPVGVGLAALTSPDESEAVSLGPILKAAGKFTAIKDFADSLEPKFGALIKQAAVLSGKTTPTDVVKFLGKVQDDIHTFSGGVRAELFDPGPDYVGVSVTHPDLGPFPIATIRGAVDAHSGTWYPQIRNTPLGFTKEGMRKVFEQVKKEQPLVAKIENPKSLAGVLAATAVGSAIYDIFMPDQAEAATIPTKPIIDLLSKGTRGVGDDVLEDIARAKGVDDLINIAYTRAKQVTDSLLGKNLDDVSIEEGQFAKFDTWGKLMPENQQMLGAADSGEGMNSIFRFRPPGSATENPLWQGPYAYLVRKKQQLLTGEGSTLQLSLRKAQKMLDESGLKPDEYPLWYRALHGLKTTASGGMVQTEAGIPSRINDIAKKFHPMNDQLWTANTGVDTKAAAIFDDLGLEWNTPNWKMIKKVQLKKFDEPMPRGADAKHIAAAKAMQGMINTKPYQWRNLATPYSRAKFIVRPVEQEQYQLNYLIDSIKERYGKNMPADVVQRLGALEKRLGLLKAKERQPLANLPSMDVLRKYRFSPFEDGPDIPKEVQETDPSKLLRRHIDGALSKLFFDEQNATMKVLIDYFKSPLPDGTKRESAAVADYITEFMNTLNGTKAMRGDTRLASTFNSIISPFTDKRVSVDAVRKYANAVLEFTWLTKLGFGLRYPLVNATQPWQTTVMVTGTGPLARAYGKIINDPSIWEEARISGVLEPGTSRAMSEIERIGDRGAVAKILDWLPNKSENLNRVVTYQAGKDWALDQLARTGTVKVPHFVRGFNRQVLSTGDPDKISKEVGAALVRTTQFMYRTEGRAVALTGGAARRILTQFKSFTSNYVDLMMGAMEHARRTGDVMPAMRGFTSLFLFGGLAAIPGATLVYGPIRNEFMKRGVQLPDENTSGLGSLMAVSASTFGSPETSDQVKDALRYLQIGSSFSMINLPGLGGDEFHKGLVQFAAGPTFGPALQAGGEAGLGWLQGGVSRGEAMQTGLRAVSPTLASGLEAAQMAGFERLNQTLSDLGYRGGIYSPTGRLLAKQQDNLSVISRALNLQPSLRSQRYKYMRDIISALEGGQVSLAEKIQREAQRQGFIINKEDMARAKGAATRKKSEKSKPNEPLY